MQGIAAFDDYYSPSDVCTAHNLLASDADWLASPPDVAYAGNAYPAPNGSDTGESNLDVQARPRRRAFLSSVLCRVLRAGGAWSHQRMLRLISA